MNKNLLLAFLSVIPLATGCVINGGGHPQPKSGDVTFAWTFYNQTCAQDPSIQSVHIVIPGESLANNGTYPCTANGYAGIVLHDFSPATYNFTIDALDYTGNVVYTSSGSFTVNGNVLVTVDLTPVTQPGSWAYLTWTFPAESGITHPCSDRGITSLEVQIDSNASVFFNCDDGLSAPGVKTALLAPGTHTIKLWAEDSTGYVYYSKQSTLITASGSPSQQQYSLNWAVGGVALKWQLTSGSSGRTCTQAGVNTMYATFQDTTTGAVLYGKLNDISTWDVINNFCTTSSYLRWPYLPPGTYAVYLEAVGTGVKYDSNFQSAPTVTVSAGTFPTEAQALPVTMYLQ